MGLRRAAGVPFGCFGRVGRSISVDLAVQRQHRLREGEAFRRVRREGAQYRNRWIVVLVAPNGSNRTRFGFIVGRRRGTAVVRNTIKRRLREAARLLIAEDKIKPGYDVVIIARAAAVEADFHTLRAALCDLLSDAGLFLWDSE